MFEVVWSAAMERNGTAPGLSGASGNSVSSRIINPLFRYEEKEADTEGRLVFKRTKTPIVDRLPKIERLLSMGCSVAVVCFRTGVGEAYVYSVAKRMGLDTRELGEE